MGLEKASAGPPTLLIDAGNSRIKIAMLARPAGSPDGLPQIGPVAALEQGADDVAWRTALQAIALPQDAGTRVLMASVASAQTDQIIAAQLRRCLGSQVPVQQWNKAPLPEGFTSSYKSAGLGADRLLAAIAARRAFGLSRARVLVLASFGTATTVDTVMEMRFCGGLITPGVAMMAQSLAQGTAHLPDASGALVAVPDRTEDAIRTGIIAAQLGCITHALQAARTMSGVSADQMLLVATGGALPAIAAHLPPYESLPDAVLRGLAVIACETRVSAVPAL
jgi:type III pantothenate kinase